MRLESEISKIKWQFFHDLKNRMYRYDIDKVLYDDEYEVDDTTKDMICQLMEMDMINHTNWKHEFIEWYKKDLLLKKKFIEKGC